MRAPLCLMLLSAARGLRAQPRRLLARARASTRAPPLASTVQEPPSSLREPPAPPPVSAWSRLGLGPDLEAAVARLELSEPSPVQKDAVPGVLAGQDLLFAAATGSGKTLAYLLPTFARLKAQECGLDRAGMTELRRPGRPRALVLVPTRELAAQVTQVAKDLAHSARLSVRGAFGGSDGVGAQRRKLAAGGAYDVLVATPGRFRKLWDMGDVHVSRAAVVVVDEVDTMLSQGFGADLQAILEAARRQSPGAGDRAPATVVATTATLTKAVKRTFGPKAGRDKAWAFLPELRVVASEGLHKQTATCRLDLIDVVGRDKLTALSEVLRESNGAKCLVFCNTVASCRAAAFHLDETGVAHSSYHGELNSREREASLEAFRTAESGALVCTDLAARGLDVPDVGLVVMFDFPRNAIDYLHRAGRTARAGARGRVAALVAKPDRVLAHAVARAVANGEPVDELSSDKRAYQPGGRHAPKPSASSKGRAKRDLSNAKLRRKKPRTRRS